MVVLAPELLRQKPSECVVCRGQNSAAFLDSHTVLLLTGRAS